LGFAFLIINAEALFIELNKLEINMKTYQLETRNRLSELSPEELFHMFNNEVGNKGWGNARSIFLYELIEAMRNANIDILAISDGLNGISFQRKVKLFENRLVLED
jgi:hypothetical protein